MARIGWHQLGVMAMATGAIAVTVSGITYASSKSGAVKACSNAHGTLRLLDVHGRCPAHYSKVTLSKTGPRGVRGLQGPAGPGAISLVADTTSTSSTSTKDAKIGTTGITVEAVCRANLTSDLYLLDTTGASSYTVEGSYFYNGSGPAFFVYDDATQGSLSVGSGQIAFIQPAEKNAMSEVVNEGGQASVDILVTRGTTTVTVDASSYQGANRCWVHAEVVPGN